GMSGCQRLCPVWGSAASGRRRSIRISWVAIGSSSAGRATFPARRPHHRLPARRREGEGNMDLRLRGRRALVTGGTKGIGRVVEAALPYLERSDAASITTISSVSGREIDIVAGPYGVMKAAVVHYAQGLAYHLASKGIRANTVSPGNTYFEGGFWHNAEQSMPDLYGEVLAMNPTGRMGTAEEVAAAVVFLASPRASRISGTNLVVDGALTKGVQL